MILHVLFMSEADVQSLCRSFLWFYHEFVLSIAEEQANEVMRLSLSLLADFLEDSKKIDVLFPLIKD